MSAADVAVVGGGTIGLAVAWRARSRGLSVVLLDRGDPQGNATHVAAGMLAPVAEADVGERALLALGLESARRWPSFAAELQDVSGIDVGYRQCGTLVLARDRDEAEHLDRELELRERLGLRVTRLLPSEARRRETALAPTLRAALDVPDDHAVDPRRVAEALTAAGERAGVERRRGDVREVLVDGGRVTGVAMAGGEHVDAEHVVLAPGAWGGEIGGVPDPARVPLRPVKGQLLRLRDPAGPGLCDHVLRYQGGYLVPRGDGGYVLGATMEERGFDTSVTAGGLYELLRDASELLPGVLELEVVQTLAGLRPGTPDNAPAIGAAAGVEGLHWAAGHHRNGVLLTPVTADLLAAELSGEPEQHAFSPKRFAKEAVA